MRGMLEERETGRRYDITCGEHYINGLGRAGTRPLTPRGIFLREAMFLIIAYTIREKGREKEKVQNVGQTSKERKDAIDY